MSKRRTYVVFSVATALMIGSTVSSVSAAAPKVGSACKKIGTLFDTPGTRYVCNKEGKKLVWRIWYPGGAKNTSTSSTATTPAPAQGAAAPAPKKAAFKAPMPIKLPVSPVGAITFANILDHISDIPTTAYNNVQAVLSANSPVTVPTSIFVGPTTTFDIVGGESRIKTVLGRDEQLWSGFTQPSFYAMYVYNAADEPATEKKFKEDFLAKGYDYSSPEVLAGLIRALAGNCQQQIHPGAFTGPLTNCNGADSGSYFNSKDSFLHLGQVGNSSDPMIKDGVVIGHEYIHSAVGAQWIDSPNCVNPDNFAVGCNRSGMANHGFSPCWIHEGLPQAAGSAVAEDSLAKYLTFRDSLAYSRGPTTITDYTQQSLKDYLFNMQSPSTCYQNGPLYSLSYSVGALATEALISIAGPQAVMAIYSLGAEGQDFSTAFEHVYGISWSDASTLLSKVLAAEYATYGTPPK